MVHFLKVHVPGCTPVLTAATWLAIRDLEVRSKWRNRAKVKIHFGGQWCENYRRDSDPTPLWAQFTDQRCSNLNFSQKYREDWGRRCPPIRHPIFRCWSITAEGLGPQWTVSGSAWRVIRRVWILSLVKIGAGEVSEKLGQSSRS